MTTENKIITTAPETMNEDMENYETELVMDTGSRLEDLAMALCHYDDVLAKQALSIALGTLCGHYDEFCLHHAFDLAETHEKSVREHIAEYHAHADESKIEVDNSNEGIECETNKGECN
jgi:hypothetical protein